MAQVCDHQGEFDARGARLVFVGSGSPEMAADFQAERCPQATVLVDPERATYRAFALRRDLKSMVSLRAVGSALGAFKAGHRQGAVQGDALQLGGAFLIDTGGSIRFAQRSEFAGDHVDPRELLRALSELPSRTA